MHKMLNLLSCLFIWLLPMQTVKAITEAEVLANLKLPDGVSLEQVTSKALYNGKTMAIAALYSAKPSATVAHSFKQQWTEPTRKHTPGHIESNIPGWLLISRVVDDFNIVVQLHNVEKGKKPLAFASGYVSVSRIKQSSEAVQHGVFSNLQPLLTNQTQDGVDTSTINVYASPTSLHRTHELTIPQLSHAGWQVLADKQLSEGWVTMLSKNTSRLELSFIDSSEFGSVLVAHKVTSK